MAAAADDQVVVHRDAERLGGIDDVARHRDVGFRWRRVAGRMVVQQAASVYIYLILFELIQKPIELGSAIGGGGW